MTNKLSNLVRTKSNEKTVEEKYQKLDEISHVLLRPARYMGAITLHTSETYIEEGGFFVKKTLTWNPALIKVFDEIITNSVDFSKREEGKHLNTIKVNINKNTGELSVWDNGGISVIKHPTYNQWIPELVFELRAGTNFNDDDEDDETTGSGQNGEGSAISLIFAKEFTVHTADGINEFKQTHCENSRKKTIPIIKPSNKHFTCIKWLPEYTRFGLDSLDDENYLKLVKRVYDVAGCNPNLKVYLNDEHIKINSFKEYVEKYNIDFVIDENTKWKIAVASAKDGFEHISFVNSTETFVGGTHIEYVSNQIVIKLKEFFKKKYKVDVKPSDIKNHLHLIIDASIVKPRYSSQTKEQLLTEPKMYKTSWECDDKFIKKIIQLEAIQNILDWVKAKEQAQLNAELRKHNKNIDKSDPKSVPKFHDATSKDRSNTALFLVEGDSAQNGILSGRDTKLHGSFPLRGKPINVYDMDIKEVIENKEFKNIMAIIGLQLGTKINSINDLRFSKIIITSDQDLDGYSIRGLLLNLFYKYWKELFTLGVIYILQTPIVKVKYKKSTLVFQSIPEFEEWKLKHKDEKYDSKYYKGLGTSSSSEWKEYLSQNSLNENLIQLKIDTEEDAKMFELLFSKAKGMTDKRKDWLQLEEVAV